MNWGEMTENILEQENDEEKYFFTLFLFSSCYILVILIAVLLQAGHQPREFVDADFQEEGITM